MAYSQHGDHGNFHLTGPLMQTNSAELSGQEGEDSVTKALLGGISGIWFFSEQPKTEQSAWYGLVVTHGIRKTDDSESFEKEYYIYQYC